MLTKRLLCAGILGLAAASHAAPITYHITLEVTEVRGPYPAGHVNDRPGDWFSPIPAVGDVFHGSLTFDDGVLATDGRKAGTPLDAFRLEIAGLVWDPNDASSIFRGFRGLDMPAPSPILVVSAGELTGLRGGVYALDDWPFVDFMEDGTFWSRDGETGILGTITVGTAAVPEPGTLALLLLGLGEIAGTAFRSRGPGKARAQGGK